MKWISNGTFNCIGNYGILMSDHLCIYKKRLIIVRLDLSTSEIEKFIVYSIYFYLIEQYNTLHHLYYHSVNPSVCLSVYVTFRILLRYQWSYQLHFWPKCQAYARDCTYFLVTISQRSWSPESFEVFSFFVAM